MKRQTPMSAVTGARVKRTATAADTDAPPASDRARRLADTAAAMTSSSADAPAPETKTADCPELMSDSAIVDAIEEYITSRDAASDAQEVNTVDDTPIYVNLAANGGDTVLDAPQRLSLDKCTYDLSQFVAAVKQTLCVGKELVLGSRTVYPEQLDQIVLRPQIEFYFFLQTVPNKKRFDAAACEKHSFPEFSYWLDTAHTFCETGVKHIVTQYSERRTDHFCPPDSPLFVHVTVNYAVFPRPTVRWPMTFKNAHFRRCFIDYCDFDKLCFSGCLFNECTFYIRSELYLNGRFVNCDFANCTFYWVQDGDAARQGPPRIIPMHDGHDEGTRSHSVPPGIINIDTHSAQKLCRRMQVTLGFITPHKDETLCAMKFNKAEMRWKCM